MFLTFGDEVEKIWKQPFTGATILWYLVRVPCFFDKTCLIPASAGKNRYLTPLGYIVIIVSKLPAKTKLNTTLYITSW